MPRERPRDKCGTSQGHPGRLARCMWKFTFKGQNVRGTDGTDDGTDGTCPRDRRDTNQGVPPKFFMFIGFFLSPETPGKLALLVVVCEIGFSPRLRTSGRRTRPFKFSQSLVLVASVNRMLVWFGCDLNAEQQNAESWCQQKISMLQRRLNAASRRQKRSRLATLPSC